MLTDSHCHLSFKDYPSDEIEGVLQRAKANGVTTLINVGAGDGFEGNEAAIKLVEKYSQITKSPLWPNLFCTVGIHPHDAKIVTPEILNRIEEMAKNPKVVAIGEIGLDFHYLHSPADIQEKVLSQFIQLAKKVGKPIMIHDRSAGDRTYEILKKEAHDSRIMIHCFTGTLELAKKYLDLGCLISFTGIITFKKSDLLREVVKMVPLNRMLIETDSPFLTPDPFRGKRNEPAYVRYVAEKVAEIKQIPFDEVAQKTTENALRFFKISSI